MGGIFKSRQERWWLGLALALPAAAALTGPVVAFEPPSLLRILLAVAILAAVLFAVYRTWQALTERARGWRWPTDAATASPLLRIGVLLVALTAIVSLLNFAQRAGWFTPLVLLSAFALMIWTFGYSWQIAQTLAKQKLSPPYRLIFIVPWLLAIALVYTTRARPPMIPVDPPPIDPPPTLASAQDREDILQPVATAPTAHEPQDPDGTPAPSSRDVELLVDIANMSPAARSRIYSALIGMQQPIAWREIPIAQGDTLNQIIREQYRIADAPTRDVLIDRILEANSIQDADRIRAGRLLAMPTLPKRPYTFGFEQNAYQQFDLRPAEGPSLQLLASEEPPRPELADSAAISIMLGSSQVATLIGGLPLDSFSPPDLHSIFVRFGTQTAAFEPQTAHDTAPPAASLPAAPNPTPIDHLDAEGAPPYSVIDFFGGDCEHGDLVLEAAQTTLHEIGAGALATKIEPVELDLFLDKEKSLAEIDRFIDWYKPARFYPKLQEDRDAVARMERPGERYEVVLLYLQAVLHNRLAGTSPAIVSLSYSTQTELKGIVPLSYGPNTFTSFLAAVPNLSNVTVEDSTMTFHVPQSTLLGMQRSHGAMLVGSFESDGSIFGMSSADGSGVSTIANGVLRSARPACGGREERGTSIATPRVAAHLLAAKVAWGKAGAANAREVRTRAVLASQPKPEYLGKFASGGPPDIRKLAHAKRAVVEGADGRVEAYDRVEGRVHFAEGESAFGYSAGRLPNPHLIRGLRLTGRSWWVYFESIGAWTRAQVERVNLTLRLGDSEQAIDLETFVNNYREIILL